MAEEFRILQLKIRLLGISPMIWRRVLVRSDIALQELHGVIQVAMGWEGIHLYQFVAHADYYGSPDLHLGSPKKPLDAFGFRENDRFSYIYDMGDYWEHEIRVEAILESDQKKSYPLCTGGAQACPPEDCGGVHGYLEGRDEARGIDAWQDMNTMLEWLDSVSDEASRKKLVSALMTDDAEAAIQRVVARAAYLGEAFSRKEVNSAFRRGAHLEMMHQQY